MEKLISADIIVKISKIKEIMVKNATWQTDISNLLDSYSILYNEINTWCIEIGIVHKNKFFNLWNFYNYWRNDNNKLTTYESRRIYINNLYDEFSLGKINEIKNNTLDGVQINKNILSHISLLLENGHYFNAVEESYKITREKLMEITGKEKAHEAFKEGNYEKIFGKKGETEAEKNFFEGVKFLHLAIQNFRNEKAHTPAKSLDKNKALHYIFLSSLAYNLIDKEII